MTLARAAGRDADADVLVVGYGPVGQVLSLMLARRGWRVVVAEQWPAPFQLPRAVTFDGHAARILAACGTAGALPQIGEPSADYVVENGAGQTLLLVKVKRDGRHGWPDSTSMHQPALEAALCAMGAAEPRLALLRGHRVAELRGHEAGVTAVMEEAVTGSEKTVVARWAVGCDGANSLVRQHIGSPVTDFGFSVDWMACDVTPSRPADFPPSNVQVADPARPRVAVSAGHGHRRFEFMRLPAEDAADFGTVEGSWRLLALFGVTPGNAILDRHAVYTIRARCARRWRAERIFIAGDAAHQMPPFAGQGLCSGIRDAANLAWKLDAVLSGRAGEALLDTYETERKANVTQVIKLSVWLGNLICQSDATAAARRDAAMRHAAPGGGGSADIPDSLTAGVLHHGERGERAAHAGSLLPQGLVTHAGRTGWSDEVMGYGSFLFLAREEPGSLLGAGPRRFLDSIGTRLVQVVPPVADIPAGAFADTGGVFLPWLESLRAVGVLVRPDFYVFGAAPDRAGITALVAALRSRLNDGLNVPGGEPHDAVPAAR